MLFPTDSTKQIVAIQTQIPTQLVEEALSLVTGGWYRDLDEVLLDALRRFLDSHRVELMEQFIREDVTWGLYGKE